MSESVIDSVLDRKRARANLSYSILKSIIFLCSSIVFFLLQNYFDVVWEYLGVLITTLSLICFVSELFSILGLFLARPISLTEKQSKLLNAAGVDFVRQKPKPTISSPKRPLESESLSSCLFNRSQDSMNLTPTKKSVSQTLNQSVRSRISLLSSPNRSIKDEKELDDYLENINSPSSNESILFHDHPKKTWTSPLRSLEPLSRFTYHISKFSPVKLSNDTSKDSNTVHKGRNAWTEYAVDQNKLNNWTINLRKYLHATIVSPLVTEINIVNKQLKANLPDVQLGKTSISDLRQISHPVSTEIRRLASYMEVTVNHNYLIQRLKTLSQEGYLSSYIWNGGENYNGKPWSKELPNDSQILIHILSSWLDTHLPPDPSAGPDAKAFTDQYIRKQITDEKLKKKMKTVGNKLVHNLPPRVPVALIQHSVNPPEYYVQIGNEVKEVPPGRNNPLQAVLLFFHLLEKDNYGELSGVSLGPAGINILTIFK